MKIQNPNLAELGWNTFFASQIQPDDPFASTPVRVMAVHRSGLRVAGSDVDRLISPFNATPGDDEAIATVGDWLLLDPATDRATRLLQRKSLFKRRAAGTSRKLQLIAANVDTLFIVTSCNQDFNVARLERYLALARDADVTPLVVLTKADLTDDPASYVRAAAKLAPGLMVEVMDARQRDAVACLSAWCGCGQTVAFVGSSGVGKSTLVNTLCGDEQIATQGIREDDGKGRHTTTARALHRLPAGGWLLDTPGMRELQLTDVGAGISEVFDDIVAIAQACRFDDCCHESEPGCAVLAAIKQGTLDDNRLKRWRKLVAEDAVNSQSLAERRARDRAFGKMIKRTMQDKRRRRE
jgi:ribosome biogenesis GTPase / thiamine phosphate phosphatase